MVSIITRLQRNKSDCVNTHSEDCGLQLLIAKWRNHSTAQKSITLNSFSISGSYLSFGALCAAPYVICIHPSDVMTWVHTHTHREALPTTHTHTQSFWVVLNSFESKSDCDDKSHKSESPGSTSKEKCITTGLCIMCVAVCSCGFVFAQNKQENMCIYAPLRTCAHIFI